MEKINVFNIFLKGDDKGNSTGVCNVQCLSKVVYMNLSKKLQRVYQNCPHPKNLIDISKPLKMPHPME